MKAIPKRMDKLWCCIPTCVLIFYLVSRFFLVHNFQNRNDEDGTLRKIFFKKRDTPGARETYVHIMHNTLNNKASRISRPFIGLLFTFLYEHVFYTHQHAFDLALRM